MHDSRRTDWLIAALAFRQNGVVATGQLLDLGILRTEILHRARTDRLLAVHHGVWAVGHRALHLDGRRRAALLLCGELAVLSHRSAAYVEGIRSGDREIIELSVPSNSGRAPRGVHLHRVASLTAADRTTEHGFPCTTVARTIVDLAAVLDADGLRSVIRQADYCGRLDVAAVAAAAARINRPRGVRALREILVDFGDTEAVERNVLVERYLRFCSRFDIPVGAPEQEIRLGDGGRRYADFLHPGEMLAVELDGRSAHERLGALADDKRRDRELAAVGLLTFRIAAADMTPATEDATAQQLLDALAHRRQQLSG